MVTLCAIASGSNGNCYYIGNEREAVLIDAGISARRIITRIHQQQLNPAGIKALFISHEHADHASGSRVLAKKLNIPVYITARTYVAMYPNHKPLAPRFFDPAKPVSVGSLTVHPFLKNHDAAEPCSFRIEYKGIHVGVFTDIGSICDRVINNLQQCHALFLETNYDEKMLWEGRYPWLLKKRIASDHGHLSNDQAFMLLKNHAGMHLKAVFASHLSAENNNPETVKNCLRELDNRFTIHITSRHAAGEVVRLESE